LPAAPTASIPPPRPSVPPRGAGKEELRAALLKPYVLRLRAERDDATVRALLSTVGLPAHVIDDETAWISVAAARRALGALEMALGPGSLKSRGAFMTHPENLGTYVRMLRVAKKPIDAYRYLADNAGESTRVGAYEIAENGAAGVRVTYTPREDDESPQDDPIFCQAREGELRSLTRLWGLADADVAHAECIARGGDACVYDVRWPESGATRLVAIGTGAGAIVSGGAVAVAGSLAAAGIAAVLGAGGGYAIGRLTDRARRERESRTFENNRIAALERGLELKGESHAAPGDLTGVVLGAKYRIESKIGSGGIGAVYAAEHVALGSLVAVKVLRGAAARDASEIARLRREAQVQVSIEHPNVVRTFDLDQMPDGSIYVVMELLRGQSLAEKMMREGPVAPGFAIPAFVQACRALEAAHERGIIHRDMKPGNIFLCDDGTAKVLDFGMSKFASAESLTQEGYTLGTPEYMAPEQCIGAPVEPRTDLYAFGVLMYEALTGDLPIQSTSRRELLELHQRQRPASMRERRPDLQIPELLDGAVMKTLEKRLDDRPASARELERMLSAIPLEGLPLEYPPGTPRTRR
jgi:hypothetical protein